MTVNEILALLPPGATNARALIRQIGEVAESLPSWQAVLDNFTPDRVRRMASQMASGRTDDDLRDDILTYMVGEDRLLELGINENTAQAIMLGANEGGQNLGAVMNLPKVQDTLNQGKVDADNNAGTDKDPVKVGDTVIPQGARLVRVRNPVGSDAKELYYLVYEWNGVQLAYEVGDTERLNELFGGVATFDDVSTFNQAQFDRRDFVEVGSVDQIVGSTESLGSQIQREVRNLGFEDLPAWLNNSPEAKALIAQATAQEWSTGRLWTELAKTSAFTARFGRVIEKYSQGGIPIGTAVEQIVADETAMRDRLRQFQRPNDTFTNAQIHSLMLRGWTADSAGQVLGQMQILESNPEALAQANRVMAAAGLPALSPVDFLNGINGFGPPRVVKALNAAAAGVALREAGLKVTDETIDTILDVVDTADRLLTVDSFQQVAQELTFNVMRFGNELDFKKLGVDREDLVAAAFGESSPTGKNVGEVLNLLARFERDRRAAGEGFDDASAFQDKRGRLIIQGLAGL